MIEQMKYDIIKKLVETDGNKDRAAIQIGCTRHHINRLTKGYREHEKTFFVHGNRGRKPAHMLPDETKQTIINLYRTKYYGANFSFYTELLAKYENIKVSSPTVRLLIMAEGILSPRATAPQKKLRIQLKKQKKAATSKKVVEQIDRNLVLLEDSHPRRPRCSFFGEMPQMDASPHN